MATKLTTKFRKIISLFLALNLILLLLPDTWFTGIGTTMKAQAANEINGHSLIAENDNLALYMNEEDLSVVVEDKATGAYMESSISYDDGKNNNTWMGAMSSALVLTLINQNDDTKQADLLNDDVTKNIQYTDNGFTAEVYWTTYKIGMTLEVSLLEDGLMARVADESIKEDGDRYYIGTIAIYPYMGTSYLDDKEGYLFVPDGNGALIYLDDKEGRFNSGYSSMIYGNDIGFTESSATSLLWDRFEMVTEAEQIIAPVYGIAHTDDRIAYLAVVEEGAMRATIEAHPNGVSVDYNRAYAKFIERRLYTQPTSNNSTGGSLHLSEAERSHSDLQIRFLFMSGDKANYAGMANAYRDYLINNGTLSVQPDSYRTRIDFMGTERESWVIGTTAVVMTTVDDIREIYADLAGENVTDIFTLYKGWQDGGLYNIPITKYKADSKIGGTGELTKLIKDAQNDGIEFYLYSDALRINPDEQNATFNVVKKINKRRFEEDTYQDVYETMLYLTPERSNALVNKFITSYTKNDVNNLCISGLSNTLFSWNYSGNVYTRYECGAKYADTMAAVKEKTNLVLEQPFAYLWQDTKAFIDMPLYTSSYIYEDESVPFLSIVLKGVMPVYSEYVNFEANKQEFFLKMVETGTYPSFYITKESASELIYTNSCDIYSSEYDVYKSTIAEYSQALKELNDKVSGAFIINHEIMDNGVNVVTYSNGVTVYVNYNSYAETVNGHTIDAMSYEVD
ncbi:MAG: hypothetical protein HDR12_02225 [Lachnospiraceae bacterium]|nr:hypothetical protein [Lachnospiraceae bacterium]